MHVHFYNESRHKFTTAVMWKMKVHYTKYSLVEVSLFYSLLAPLECFGVLVLERLQICHGPHALTFETLIVMTGFGIWP